MPQTGRPASLTITNVQATGADRTAAIWETNGAGIAVGPPVAGNTYQYLSNGVPFGNNANNTRIRNPPAAGVQTTSNQRDDPRTEPPLPPPGGNG